MSLLYTHHIVILFEVCGLPWFFPFKGFHVIISCLVFCVLCLLAFTVIAFLIVLEYRLWPIPYFDKLVSELGL